MSHVEYYDGLAEIALGWLGWSEEQALRADVNAIQVGFDGKVDMFRFIGYVAKVDEPAKPQAPQAPLPKMNPRLFSAMFGRSR